jgi:hypothetical protein
MTMALFSSGIENFRRKYTLWPLLYFVRAGLTVVYSLPFLVLVDNTLTSSPYARPLMKVWSVDVITELLSSRQGLLSSFVLVLLFYLVLVFLVKQFLNGGIYHSLLSHERVERYTFFGESARLWLGNLKISAIIVVLYFALLLVGLVFAAFVPYDAFGHFGSAILQSVAVKVLILYAFLILGFVLSDLMRLRLAAHPGERLSESFKAAMSFYVANFVKCYGTYVVYFVPFLVFLLFAEWLAVIVTSGLDSVVGVVLELLIFQIVIAVQIGQSLLYTATIAPLFRSHQPGRFRQIVQGELRLD